MIFTLKRGLVAEASISIESEALQFGLGLFETLKAKNGKAFLLEEHVQRLVTCAETIGLEAGVSEEQIIDFAQTSLTHLVPETLCRVKLIATGEDVFLIAKPLSENFELDSISLLPLKKNRSIPAIKSLNYLDCHLAFGEAQKQGYDDALLYACKDKVRETSRANIFWVQGGEIFTTTHLALAGITQAFVMANFVVTVAEVTLGELNKADEAFMTNSIQGVCPVTKIGEQVFESGPMTKKVQAFYQKQEALALGGDL
ncbi:MAG: aminotransferase class IV [SAR324 cluster bacterium]|nr:aminotransferase class IV [SAR324 cluster bacterium]